ncbi:ASXH domain-containing protein [Chaetomium strumarium]|uniref:Asx homology domain-containing protein n=1 Tax=Chaetomium strumarium TaxID=1170767 RepID=A0AAJ0GYR3_9PEZI|nr:Asx homology domain-containing protein [Chaetomium strumarium]
MTDRSSSPLSSPPPESVINVATGSPARSTKDILDSAGRAESPAVPVPSPAVIANINADASEPVRKRSAGSDRSTVQKRKAKPARLPAPAKRARAPPAAKRSRPPPPARTSARNRKWEAPFVYTDSKSPLTKADLRSILLLPQAWDVLAQEEKQVVLAKFPNDTHILDVGTPDARPNLVSLRNDDNFRHDCARYRENLESGWHDEEWLRQAWVAHEKMKRGDYDQFLREQFEADWETELPKESKPEGPKSDHGMEAGPSKSEQVALERTSGGAPITPITPITPEPAGGGSSQQQSQNVEVAMGKGRVPAVEDGERPSQPTGDDDETPIHASG